MSRDEGKYIRLVDNNGTEARVAILKCQEPAVYAALTVLSKAIERDSFNLHAFLDGCEGVAENSSMPDWAKQIGRDIMIEVIAIFGGMDFIDGKILIEHGVVARGERYDQMHCFVQDTINADTIIIRQKDLP